MSVDFNCILAGLKEEVDSQNVCVNVSVVTIAVQLTNCQGLNYAQAYSSCVL